MDYLVDRKIITTDDFANFKVRRHNSLLNNINLILEENYILRHVSCPITAFSFEQFIKKINTPLIKTKRFKSVLNRSKFMAERCEENNTHNSYSQYRYRYVIAEIVSTLWHEQFSQSSTDEKQTMVKNFESYLSHTDTANLETACKQLVGLKVGSTFESYLSYIKTKTL